MTPGNHGKHFFLEIEIVTTTIVNSKSLKKICRQLLSTMNVLQKFFEGGLSPGSKYRVVRLFWSSGG